MTCRRCGIFGNSYCQIFHCQEVKFRTSAPGDRGHEDAGHGPTGAKGVEYKDGTGLSSGSEVEDGRQRNTERLRRCLQIIELCDS